MTYDDGRRVPMTRRLRDWMVWYLDPVLLMIIGFVLVMATFIILVMLGVYL